MARFAEGLVIAGAPEKPLVAAMRHNMVHHGGEREDQAMQAEGIRAQRMLGEELPTIALPLAVIAALRCSFTCCASLPALLADGAVPRLNQSAAASGTGALGALRQGD